MTTFLPPPPQSGDAETQLRGLRTYLFSLSEQLNLALTGLDERNFAPSVRPLLRPAPPAATPQELSAVRSLVVKTADTVRAELDRLTQTLQSDYLARSDYGSYLERKLLEISADAGQVELYFQFFSELKADQQAISASFSDYRSETAANICVGIVDWAADGTPVYGIAIGRGMTVTETTASDGSAVKVVEKKSFRSVFTDSELSFWDGDRKVAYISNRRLYLPEAAVTGRLTLGAWELTPTSGLRLKWLG